MLIVYFFVNYADGRKAPVTTGQYKSGIRKINGIWWYDETRNVASLLLRLCKTALYLYSADLVCMIFRQGEETCDYRSVLKSPDYIFKTSYQICSKRSALVGRHLMLGSQINKNS